MRILTRRSSPTRQVDVRAVGLEAAVGMSSRAERVDGADESTGLTCGTCGSTGRIDMIDMTERRAYLTCPRCERTWDTDRDSVPQRAFSSRPQ